MPARARIQEREAPAVDGACLLERLQRPRATCDGELPDGTPIVWRLLTASEKQVAKGKARARMQSVGLDPADWAQEDELAREVAWQMIAIAMRDPRVRGSERNPYPQPAAWELDKKTQEKLPSADKLRDALSVAEAVTLLNQYLDFEDRNNPQPDRLTADEESAIVEAIKKKDSETLSSFGCTQLAIYLLTTESPRETSQTGKSTPGLDSETQDS